jgi:hypothetical protein
MGCLMSVLKRNAATLLHSKLGGISGVPHVLHLTSKRQSLSVVVNPK